VYTQSRRDTIAAAYLYILFAHWKRDGTAPHALTGSFAGWRAEKE